MRRSEANDVKKTQRQGFGKVTGQRGKERARKKKNHLRCRGKKVGSKLQMTAVNMRPTIGATKNIEQESEKVSNREVKIRGFEKIATLHRGALIYKRKEKI